MRQALVIILFVLAGLCGVAAVGIWGDALSVMHQLVAVQVGTCGVIAFAGGAVCACLPRDTPEGGR